MKRLREAAMKQIDILLISNMYPSKEQPEFAPFVKNIETALVENGASISKIVIEGKGQTFIEKIKKYSVFYWKMLARNMENYDIIHLSYPSHTYWPLIFKRLGKAKLVVRLHGEDLVKSEFKETVMQKVGRRWFTLPSLRRANLVVVPSKYFSTELNKTGVKSSFHIYPSGGVNRSKFYPLDMGNDLFTVGYVGRLAEGKGVEYLLEASRTLEFPHKVLIIGNGPLKEILSKQAIDLKLGNVEFAGSVPNAELVKYYNSMDVFVFPTVRKAESFGNVAIEAMACGIPVIGSEISGLKDYIESGANGYFFEPGNSKMLARQISTYYLLDESARKVMKQKACLTAERYDSKMLTVKFVEKLFSLVHEAPVKIN